jgi:hypothetical protein
MRLISCFDTLFNFRLMDRLVDIRPGHYSRRRNKGAISLSTKSRSKRAVTATTPTKTGKGVFLKPFKNVEHHKVASHPLSPTGCFRLNTAAKLFDKESPI